MKLIIDIPQKVYSDFILFGKKIDNAEERQMIHAFEKAIPSVEPTDSEDKIIRQTLENFMRGLWEEIQVGELKYTTSEVYEMLEREIFTNNHIAIPSAKPYKGMTNGQVHDMLYQMLVELKDGADRYGAEKWWNSPYKVERGDKE